MKHIRSVITLILIMALTLSLTACGRSPASDYDLEIGDEKSNILGEWSIRKREDDGEIYLTVDHHGQCEEDMDYLSFTVFDSPQAASECYEEISEDLEDRILDSGDNWLSADMPDVYDAMITGMYCLVDEIIIYTMLDISGEYRLGAYTPDPVPDPDLFDRALLKDYILDNASSIRDYVIDEILTGTDPVEESLMSRNSLISELESIGRHTYDGSGYEICKIYSSDVLDGIINGDDMPVRVKYSAMYVDGPHIWSSEDPDIINGFIDALRNVKTNRIVDDPDEMGYTADYANVVGFDLEDGTDFMIDLDGGYRIHEKDVVYELTALEKLSSMYQVIKQQP